MPDTELVIQQTTAIHPESTPMDVLRAIEAVDFIKQDLKEARALLEAQVIEWLDANGGELQNENLRWYVGKKKRIKANDVETLADAVLTATAGDLTAFCEFLSANAFKPGECRKRLGEDAFAGLFTVEEVQDLKTGKPKREVKKVDTRYIGGGR